MGKINPSVAWAQDKLRLTLTIEIKPKSNSGKAEIKDLEVKFLEKRIIVTYTIDDDHYELDQTLPRPIVPEV